MDTPGNSVVVEKAGADGAGSGTGLGAGLGGGFIGGALAGLLFSGRGLFGRGEGDGNEARFAGVNAQIAGLTASINNNGIRDEIRGIATAQQAQTVAMQAGFCSLNSTITNGFADLERRTLERDLHAANARNAELREELQHGRISAEIAGVRAEIHNRDDKRHDRDELIARLTALTAPTTTVATLVDTLS
jgi:hypothetical protein